MKVFLLVIIVATFLGGLIGGELLDRSFSITGSVLGGLGTAGFLLCLGWYFDRQEKRRAGDALPPEIRAVIGRMLSGYEGTLSLPQRTWTPRPFHKCESRQDTAEWFRNVKPWSRVDSRIISAIIQRLYGNPMFELFVHASQDCEIVEQYVQLKPLAEAGCAAALLPKIAEELCIAGARQGAKFAERLRDPNPDKSRLAAIYGNAINACEAAIHVEPGYLLAYPQLALLKQMVGKPDDAAVYCKRGLLEVQRIKEGPVGKHRPDLLQSAEVVGNHLVSILRISEDLTI